MTAQKHLKQRIRTRMQKTNESYTTARRQVLRQTPGRVPDGATRWHFPGNIPATAALRVILAHAGMTAPKSKEPLSEAMLFGIAGGIGIGVFSFFYEKEKVASFFVAGRHSWQDDVAYLVNACRRLGAKTEMHETSSATQAEKQLREVVANGPCVAWVDMAHLPHRALPAMWSGGGYHVVTVYRVTDKDAVIGDLTDDPISISLADLAKARLRIKKQKHRLLSISATAPVKDLAKIVRDGLSACYQGLGGTGWKNFKTNFSLKSLQIWADRMGSTKDKERWERVFERGPRLWTGLQMMHMFIEHYGTGGGLCRPMFADFVTEAADVLGDSKLRALVEPYADLGQRWSELAHAALPDNVPEFREARELHRQKAELTAAGGPTEEIHTVWTRLSDLERRIGENFPLSEADCADLRADLQGRIQALYEKEVAAHTALGKLIA